MSRMLMGRRTTQSALFTAWVALSASPLVLAGCVIEHIDSESFEDTDVSDAQGCQVGHEGCACTSGGVCNAPFYCAPNINICVADTCPVGTEACACTPNGACDEGLVCASDLCVEVGCSPGTETCTCTDGGGCDPGLACLSGLCVEPVDGSDDSDDASADETGGGASESGGEGEGADSSDSTG